MNYQLGYVDLLLLKLIVLIGCLHSSYIQVKSMSDMASPNDEGHVIFVMEFEIK